MFHVLNYGPILVANSNTPQYDVNVVSAPWTAIQGTLALDLTSGGPIDNPADSLAPMSTNYMIDYQNGAIAVPAETYDQVFVFTVTSAVASTSPPPHPVTLTIDVPAYNSTTNPNPYSGTVWMSFAVGTPSVNYLKTPTTTSGSPVPAAPWVPGSDVLYRPFSFVPNPTAPAVPAWNAFGADPYQFSFANPSYTITSTASVNNVVNVGTLIFNPLLPLQQGQGALNVRASYVVYDWHILHEDHSIPALNNAGGTVIGQTTIRLMVDNIKATGAVQQDGSIYSGLYHVIPGINSDFAFVDLDTGLQISGLTVLNRDTDPTTALTLVDQIGVSYRNGYLYLPPFLDPAPASSTYYMQHFRVYYRGTLDWGVAVQRAPTVYVPTPYLTSPPGIATQTYFDTPLSLVPPAYTSSGATVPVGADTYFLGSAGPFMAFLPPPSTGSWRLVDLNTPNLYFLDPTTNNLYLPLCDFGKTFTLHNVTVTVGTGTSQQSGTLSAVTLAATQASRSH